jgi:hypothetical protein
MGDEGEREGKRSATAARGESVTVSGDSCRSANSSGTTPASIHAVPIEKSPEEVDALS